MKVEFSCDPEVFDGILKNGFRDELSRIFRDKFRLQLDCKPIGPVVAVQNRRAVIPFATEVGKYIVHFDTFCFRSSEAISQDFCEIEIACETPLAVHDEQLQRLLRALQELVDFEPHKKTKFRRAIEWSRSKGQEVRTVHCVMFDIVGYSRTTADIQKQSIIAFSNYLREAIIDVGAHEPEEIIYIPTGDGLIFVVESNPQFLVGVVFDLQKRVRDHNDRSPDRCFSFRTGIHSGPVFKYLDINQSRNYAGNGINLAQRVMNIGDAGHILATREAFETIAGTDCRMRGYFHELPGEYGIKHGDKLKVYNVYDSEGYGNELAPGSRS
jgi:class 3 adenylate cyclase